MMARLLMLFCGLLLLAGCDRSERPDFHYKVLTKTYTQGALVETGEIDRFGARVKERVDPRYEVFFKGVESGREYPPMLVSENAYKSFVQGVIYDRAALNAARK